MFQIFHIGGNLIVISLVFFFFAFSFFKIPNKVVSKEGGRERENNGRKENRRKGRLEGGRRKK